MKNIIIIFVTLFVLGGGCVQKEEVSRGSESFTQSFGEEKIVGNTDEADMALVRLELAVVNPPPEKREKQNLGEPKPTCVSNTAPIFTAHITDLGTVRYIVPPPTMGAGPSLKPHSYIGTDHVRVPVYAPTDLTLKDGSHYIGGPYMFDFAASCEVTVRFGHMTEPIDALKQLLPTDPKDDSRIQSLPALSFAAGELIGYTQGTSLAGNWDFGVYNSAFRNRYDGDPEWGNSDTYTTAVCPFQYFAPNLKSAYVAKFNSTALGGNPPHGDSFCNE